MPFIPPLFNRSLKEANFMQHVENERVENEGRIGHEKWGKGQYFYSSSKSKARYNKLKTLPVKNSGQMFA